MRYFTHFCTRHELKNITARPKTKPILVASRKLISHSLEIGDLCLMKYGLGPREVLQKYVFGIKIQVFFGQLSG